MIVPCRFMLETIGGLSHCEHSCRFSLWVNTMNHNVFSQNRRAIYSLEKAYDIFSEQKDLYGSLMDFS